MGPTLRPPILAHAPTPSGIGLVHRVVGPGPPVGALPRARPRIRARPLPDRRIPPTPCRRPLAHRPAVVSSPAYPAPLSVRLPTLGHGLAPTAWSPSGVDCCTDAGAPWARAQRRPARAPTTATAGPIALLEPAVDRARCSAPYGRRSPYPASSRSAIRCSRSPIARLPSGPFCSAVRISRSASDRIPTAAASSAPSSRR